MLRVACVMGKRVLAVDDEPGIQMLLRMILAENGLDVLTASNGEEALDLVRKSHPDLILLDVVMPKKGGAEVVAELRNSEETRELPIIIISANANLEELSVAPLVQGLMVKPFDVEDLMRKVNDLLQNGGNPG